MIVCPVCLCSERMAPMAASRTFSRPLTSEPSSSRRMPSWYRPLSTRST
ncbi:Uncharacterised protein [Bordetella pertussis]|nr:Uncharacterised protein [Bordetella pertussis]